MREVHKVKVIFGDTDAMGVAYYGNYLRWFEIGRVELLRTNGISYRDLTDQGIHLPVIETGCKYLRPARYDDEITIFSGIERIEKVRIRFAYRIESGGETLTTGFTEHAFTDKEGRVIRPPEEIVKKIKKVRDAL
jgi:acyl-CoA thioester hydrolase